MSDALLAGVAAYYGGKLAAHGATPLGVDWRTAESQALRFDQLARVWPPAGALDVVDYGCGYGALADYLHAAGRLGRYVGYDVAPEMTAAAAARHRDCRFTSHRNEIEPADFAIASGIFNVKLDTPTGVWAEHVLRTIDDVAALATRGFAFNALTSYSDPEKRRADLYYADPCALFDHCKRRFSKHVALLHDYPLWEFTILVRLEVQG